jgi:hypothetical protein
MGFLRGEDTVFLDGMHDLDSQQQLALFKVLDRHSFFTNGNPPLEEHIPPRKLIIASTEEDASPDRHTDPSRLAYKSFVRPHKGVQAEVLRGFAVPAIHSSSVSGDFANVLDLVRLFLSNDRWTSRVAPLVPVVLRQLDWVGNRREIRQAVETAVDTARREDSELLLFRHFSGRISAVAAAVIMAIELNLDRVWQITPKQQRKLLPFRPSDPQPDKPAKVVADVLRKAKMSQGQLEKAILESSLNRPIGLGQNRIARTVARHFKVNGQRLRLGEQLSESRSYSVREINQVSFWQTIAQAYYAGDTSSVKAMLRCLRGRREVLDPPADALGEPWLPRSFRSRFVEPEDRIRCRRDFVEVYFPDGRRMRCFSEPKRRIVEALVHAKLEGDRRCTIENLKSLDTKRRHPGQIFRGTDAEFFWKQLVLLESESARLRYRVELYD